MNILYKVITGSKLYGISNKDSDTDIKGLFLNTRKEIVGFATNPRIETHNGKENSEKEEAVYYSVKRFLELCLKSNPTVLELAFVTEPYILYKSQISEMVCECVRKNCISKEVFSHYYGYMMDQITMVKCGKARRKEKRHEIVEKYGYDTKNCAHAYRLGVQCVELMKTGKITPTMTGHTLEVALACREGKYSLEQAVSLLEDTRQLMKAESETCKLPETPNTEAVEDCLIDAHDAMINIS